MLADYFFEEYAKTAPVPAAPITPEIPDKDTYTRAEVDDIINRKLEEAMKQINQTQPHEAAPPPDPEDGPGVDQPNEA